MRAIITRLKSDGTREKVLIDDWQDPGAPAENEVRTRTLYSGITNGTERNDLIGGNYAHEDGKLPAVGGYQNVGEVIEVGSGVQDLEFGDLLYMSQRHLEFCLEPEDRLHIKLPPEIKLEEAALFGVAGVAMRCCRNANLRIGDRMLVVGAGIVGQLVAQIAASVGARVTLCDVNAHRLEIAEAIGAADEIIDVDATVGTNTSLMVDSMLCSMRQAFWAWRISSSRQQRDMEPSCSLRVDSVWSSRSTGDSGEKSQ